MNDYLLSVILGIVEGLTEFLPVSSTAHLRICQELLGVDLSSDYWKMYSVVIQLGAVLCLPVYFRTRLRKFVATFPRGEQGNRTLLTHPLSLTALAFVVTAGPAYLLDKKIGENLESIRVMGAALLIGGAVMWVVDALCRWPRTLHMEQMSFWQAMWVGACQVVSAAFPGTSRSMATIAGGQLAGMSRSAALEFSFFLSIPTMLAATLFKLLQPFAKSWLGHQSATGGGGGGGGVWAAPLTAHQWAVLAIGFVASFVVALGVVAWFMHWVRNRGFVPFAVYRIALGFVLLQWAHGLSGRPLAVVAAMAALAWVPGAIAGWRHHSHSAPIAAGGWAPPVVMAITQHPWVWAAAVLLWAAAAVWAMIVPRQQLRQTAAPLPAAGPAGPTSASADGTSAPDRI